MKLEPIRGGGLRNIAKWSIENPYAVIAFFVGMVALAWIAIAGAIPRRFAPYVESPMVGVVTMMPGLSAQEMELYVSKPIEEQLVNVKNLRYVRSSSQDGFSIVTLEFYYGTDMQRAQVDVQTLMNIAQASLPATGANLKPSFVVPVDPLNIPVLSLEVTGDPAKGWDPVRVREFANNEALNSIKPVKNVVSVVPFGGYRRQLQVIVDRDKLASYGIPITGVRDAIDRFNVTQSAGTITNGPREAIVRVNSRALNASDVANYPIATVIPGKGAVQGAPQTGAAMGGGGMGGGASSQPAPALSAESGPGQAARVVFVRDVAKVVDTSWEKRSGYDFVDQEPDGPSSVTSGVELQVIQNPGASSAQVVPEVMKVVRQMEADYPGIHFATAYDNAHFVDVLFENVWHELGTAILLTGLAVVFFLGEWRGTLISLVTLPTSLALAILLMLPLGMTFNSGTLVGLLLSIGRLVDDSIIDIHAVERHLRMGKNAKQATIDGIAEVRTAVIASTLMMVLALLPLVFSGGIVGLMFVELVWPLIFGLLASMLVSFTLTSLLCSRLLRHTEEREADRQRPVLKYLYLLLDPIQRFLDRLERGYASFIGAALKRRFWVFAGALGAVAIGFSFYYFIGSEMMPLADTGQASAALEMEPGTSYAGTEAAVKRVESIFRKYPELQKASVEIGAESMFESWSPFYTGYQMPAVNGASMMLTFSDKSERKRTIFQMMDAIQKEALQSVPGIRRFQIKEMGSDVMATAAAPIYVNVYGPDLATLGRLGRGVLDAANKMPEMYQPFTSWSMGVPDYQIDVDPVRAQQVGMSPQSVAEQAYYSLRGGLTNEYYRLPNIRQDTILVRYAQADRDRVSDIGSLYVTTPAGRQIPLKSIARVVKSSAPTAIEHDQLQRVIGVGGFYRPGNLPSMDVAMNLVSNAYGGNPKLGIQPVNFPKGYGITLRGDMTQMMDAFRRLLSGLGLALAFMYLVLVVQFRGFLQPLQMIASLPLELAGVFTALWLAHQSFSTVSILGIIVLTGMDITTAVLMIDLIMKYRDQGIPRNEAIRRACPDRLRPILMTSTISLIVLLPVALAPKTGLDPYQPLATAVVGGLIVGTILSLFVIPVMHSFMDDAVRLVNKLVLNRDWEWPRSTDGENPASGA